MESVECIICGENNSNHLISVPDRLNPQNKEIFNIVKCKKPAQLFGTITMNDNFMELMEYDIKEDNKKETEDKKTAKAPAGKK